MTPQEMAHIHAAAFTQSRPWSAKEIADLLACRFTHVIRQRTHKTQARAVLTLI